MSALRLDTRLTERQKWDQYEEEKRKLQAMGLRPEEYERQIRELCKRLGR